MTKRDGSGPDRPAMSCGPDGVFDAAARPVARAAVRGEERCAPASARTRRPRWFEWSLSLLVAWTIALAPRGALADTPVEETTFTIADQYRMLEGIDAVGRRGFLYQVDRPTPAVATAAAPARTGAKIFLYGTIHVGRVGSEPFNAPLMTALRHAQRLALEADPSDDANARTLALRLGRYPDGDDLRAHVPPDLLERVRAFGAKNGLPPERIVRFRPWLLANMVALTTVSDAGLDASMGSELYLSGYARSLRMPVVEVEGVEAQLRMFASLPDALQVAQLDEALAEVDRSDTATQTRALFDLWVAGDRAAGDRLIEEMRRDADGKLFERWFFDTLIDARNRTMADRAESYLREPGDTFLAVGALHLFGDSGLIREFERRGYRVVDLQAAATAVGR